MGDQDGGNKARFLESACITSDVSSSGNSLGIMCTLERLDLPGKIGPICSTEVSKKRLSVGHFDSSNILEVIPILACLLLATNLTFFCNICFELSTGCTNLVHCTIEV